ncbi:hypothetical protein BXZ70DRAFT_329587 [Cristinia sonorae]|uniref:SET domain-containing protein n=1 Tax=Cristinia sonorae TaxID=1940300 RepID=A0A8K0ULI3_9AGAR|nr:hypothetical protein BXZ70DRAFT_329587 [Cristinia sonorae]
MPLRTMHLDPEMTVGQLQKTHSISSVGQLLPYGNIKHTGLPEGIEELEQTPVEFNAGKLDYADEQKIYTTQPMCFDEQGRLVGAPDSERTECFISGYLKRKIASTPNIGARIPRPSSTMYRISESLGKGLGMFATKDIPAGELILAERPLMIVPITATTTRDGDIPKHLTLHQMQQVLLQDTEVVYKVLIDRLEPDRKKAFYELANSHLHNGSGPILGRIRTNGFGFNEMRDLAPGMCGGYSIVCDELSRLNHSCSPNTFHRWDMPSFTVQLRAARHIKKDEEITTTYIDLTTIAANRQKQLAPYQIVCNCTSCANHSVSDPRRLACINWEKQNAGYVFGHFDPESKPALGPLMAAYKTYVAEGLEATSGFGQVLEMLMGSCAKHGDVPNTKLFAKKFGVWKLSQNGSAGNSKELERLLMALAKWMSIMKTQQKLKLR